MADPITAQLLSAITAALANPATASNASAAMAGTTATPYAGTTALADELIALARSGGDTTALSEELVAMARSELPTQTGAALHTLETVTATGDIATSGSAVLLGEMAQTAPLATAVMQALLQGSEPEAVIASMAPVAIREYRQSVSASVIDALTGSDAGSNTSSIIEGVSSDALSDVAGSLAQQAPGHDVVPDATNSDAVIPSAARDLLSPSTQQTLRPARDDTRILQGLLGETSAPIDADSGITTNAEPLSLDAPAWRQRLRDNASSTQATLARADRASSRQGNPRVTAWQILSGGDSHDRLIALEAPFALPLQVEHFSGHEAICADFSFQIDCLSPSAFLDLQPLLGQPLRLKLRTASDEPRHWHGYCTQIASLGSDGGLARYRLTMEPWTAFLRLRRNALIFQDTDALGAIEQVFADYPQARFRSEVTQALPTRAIITQYRETDAAFVTRLLAEAGLAWRFEHPGQTQHGNDDTNNDGSNSTDQGDNHTLVIFDRNTALPQAKPATLRFHRIDATEREDAISHFAEQRQAVPDAVSTASWQAEQVEALAASSEAASTGSQLPRREFHAMPRAGRHVHREQVQQHADLMLDALRLPHRLHAGAGSARGLAPGAAFALLQHPALSGQAFVPLVVEHIAANNAPTAQHASNGIVDLLGVPGLERGSYRNRFLAVAQGTPIVPAHRPRPLAPGAQTAIVVGLPEAATTATRDHQVRIQFPWQRGSAPHAGGLTDTASTGTPDGHAPGNERSGSWVRVAEWLAGPNWGSHTLPRIGSEVLIEFLHADIDQPLVTGQLYNGQVAPPFALADASNHPGTLSGLHHGSVDGSGHQQWVIDDARGQLRQRLATTLADSRVELGYLIEHADHQRGGYRGEGFEVATAGWGNLHAGQGLLLSTSMRAGHTRTQLDVAEAVGHLKAAEQRAQSLSKAAVQQQVPALSANARQSALLKSVDPQQDGKYTGTIGGQPTTQPQGNAREGGAPVERFATPLLFLDSPDSIAISTTKSALAYAGGALHLTAQDDTHLTAGRSFSAVAGQHAALHAHAGPLRVIAANGPVTIQAHTGELELLADQSVTLTATDDRIDVLAKSKIVLQAGQSQIVLDGGDIRFECPGEFKVKGSQQPWLGGAKGASDLPLLPQGLTSIEKDYPFSL